MRAARAAVTGFRALLASALLVLLAWPATAAAQDTRCAPSGGQQPAHLVLVADLAEVPEAARTDRLQETARVVGRRLEALGVPAPLVQVAGPDRLRVALPGEWSPDELASLLTTPARLEFRQQIQAPDGTSQWVAVRATGDDGSEQALTGGYFERVELVLLPDNQPPVVTFQFNREGTRMFAAVTARLVGQRLGVFMDNQLLVAPIVREPVRQGNGAIQGRFTVEQARRLAILLSTGALPVPMRVLEGASP